MKKNAALLGDERALWLALFAVFDQLGEAFQPSGFGESLLRPMFTTSIRAVLISLYRADDLVATASLRTMTWELAAARYVLDDATAIQLRHLRACNDRDTDRALDVLRQLGALTIEDEAAELTGLGRAGMQRLLGEPEPGDPVYQVKITLAEVENPPVWRRALIPAAVGLDRLHEVIQAVLGWRNAHLHVFADGQTQYGVPDPELGFRDEHTAKLNGLVRPGERLSYTYDFGDDWEHEIAIEEQTIAEPGKSYPRCVAGHRACPPEDCGGPPGYAELVRVLADPRHAEHEGMLAWLGLDEPGQFDPARFAVDEANRRLADASHTGLVLPPQ